MKSATRTQELLGGKKLKKFLPKKEAQKMKTWNNSKATDMNQKELILFSFNNKNLLKQIKDQM